MIIIYGTRGFEKILGQTVAYSCARCNNIALFNVVRIRKWFTLFWIPIFPYSSKYYMVCPVCGSATPFPSKADALQLIVPAAAPQNPAIQ